MENKTQIKDVELPFFFGFYNSPLEDDYEIDEAINDEVNYHNNELGENVEYGDFDFNATEYRKAIVKCFVDSMEHYLPDWIQSIESADLDSPKEYNFRTDRIYVTVTLKEDWKKKLYDFFEANKTWLTERIRADWTSRSGFQSWIHNDIYTFFMKLMEAEPRYLSIVMQYSIELNEGKNVNDMLWQLTDDTMDAFWSCHSMTEYVYKTKTDNAENDNES